jgi:hypothetical protein
VSYQHPPPRWPPDGTAPYGYPQPPFAPQLPQKGDGFAVSALVLGIVGCAVANFPIFGAIAFPAAGVGLVLGIVAIRDANKGRRPRKVMAIIGTALCGLALILTVVWIVLLTAVIVSEA